jgi:hypothetical protein
MVLATGFASKSLHRKHFAEDDKMRMTTRTIRGWVFGVGTAAALGFGGAQAMAAPSGTVDGGAVCNPEVCNRVCQSIPGSIGGFCTSDGSCQCYIGG